MTLRDFGFLVVLGALWGGSYLFLRVAAPVLGAFLLIDLRVIIAAGVLFVYALLIGRRPDYRKRWRSLLLLGAINAAMPFTFIASATINLNASIASILNATTPLFGALVAALWLHEELGLRRIAGLLIGLVGVGVLVGWSPLGFSNQVWWGVLGALAGAVCYGIGGVYAKVAFRDMSTLDLAIGQQAAAALLLLPLAAASLHPIVLSPAVIGAVVALGLLSTALGYLIYFGLITRVGPTNTLSVTFLVPVFGTLWGVLLLHEPLRASLVIGLIIILTGVFLVTGLRLPGGAKSLINLPKSP